MTKNATLNIRTTPEEIALWKRAAHGKLAPWVRDALNMAAMTSPGMGAIIFSLSRATDDALDDVEADDAEI